MLKKYMIERNLPDVGKLAPSELGGAAKTSNKALAQLMGIQWQFSFVAANKTFCVYLAESEDLIKQHAELSGFPATIITEIKGLIDPSTEGQCPIVASGKKK